MSTDTHNVLIIGGGGREHAIAWKLSQSPKVDTLYIIPGNPGTFDLAEHLDVDMSDHDAVAEVVNKYDIDLVVVGPEQPLVAGLTDRLKKEKVFVFGPDKYAAQLEGSKSFAKQIMAKQDVPTAAFAEFNLQDEEGIGDYLARLGDQQSIVLKADGLAGGKGVFVCSNKEEALRRVDEMRKGKLRDAASTLVIEEFMEGDEASVFALCDGEDFVTLTPAQDHKRIGENDTGLNTGGMGAYSPAPIVTNEVLEQVKTQIIRPVLNQMREEGHPYVGVLYVGLMIRDGFARVVEFNCRFGDPECQVILPQLKSDLFDILWAAVNGVVDQFQPEFHPGYHCSVVLASEGYPEAYDKGKEIVGVPELAESHLVFHSGTCFKEGRLLTNGGRVLNIVGNGETLRNAIEHAYEGVELCSFDGMYYRRDIGKKGLD